MLPSCRNLDRSSTVRPYPVRCSIVYWSAQAWPFDRTNRSRPIHLGEVGEYLISSAQRRYAMGAQPIGAPGWPLLADSGWSAETARIVLTHNISRAGPV